MLITESSSPKQKTGRYVKCFVPNAEMKKFMGKVYGLSLCPLMSFSSLLISFFSSLSLSLSLRVSNFCPVLSGPFYSLRAKVFAYFLVFCLCGFHAIFHLPNDPSMYFSVFMSLKFISTVASLEKSKGSCIQVFSCKRSFSFSASIRKEPDMLRVLGKLQTNLVCPTEVLS